MRKTLLILSLAIAVKAQRILCPCWVAQMDGDATQHGYKESPDQHSTCSFCPANQTSN